MARPLKNTADYFPHKCGDGPNKFVIQQQFGNDGYATWIKTLEILTVSENHVFDYNNPSKWLFLCAKMGVSDDTLKGIYGLMVQLGILDDLLYQKGVLYCGELVESLGNLYDRRKIQKPDKSSIYRVYGIKNIVNVNNNGVNDDIKPQSIVEYSKVEDSKVYKGIYFEDFFKLYDKNKNRLKAMDFWRIMPEDEKQAVMKVLPDYIKSTPSKQFRLNPDKYLEGRAWEDEIIKEDNEIKLTDFSKL